MFLDMKIPEGIINKPITIIREYDGIDIRMEIGDASYILRKNSEIDYGYNLNGYAYDIDRTDGAFLYGGPFYTQSLGSDLDSTLTSDIIREYKWVYDIIKDLLKNSYSIKLFLGDLGVSYPTEFNKFEKLSVEDLKNIYTVLDYNVLYTIYDK